MRWYGSLSTSNTYRTSSQNAYKTYKCDRDLSKVYMYLSTTAFCNIVAAAQTTTNKQIKCEIDRWLHRYSGEIAYRIFFCWINCCGACILCMNYHQKFNAGTHLGNLITIFYSPFIMCRSFKSSSSNNSSGSSGGSRTKGTGSCSFHTWMKWDFVPFNGFDYINIERLFILTVYTLDTHRLIEAFVIAQWRLVGFHVSTRRMGQIKHGHHKKYSIVIVCFFSAC